MIMTRNNSELLKPFGLSLNMSKEQVWETLNTSISAIELSYIAGRRSEDEWYNYFLKLPDMNFDSVKFSNVWAVRVPNQEILTLQFIDNTLINLNKRLYDGKGELKEY